MTLEKALSIASMAHEGQLDKGGNPYILHCIQLMMVMDTEDERILSLLHDVLEKTNVTLEELKENGFPEHLEKPLLLLTKKPRVSYKKYIEAIAENPLATKIMMADISHDINPSRIPCTTLEEYKKRAELEKYRDYLTENGSVCSA